MKPSDKIFYVSKERCQPYSELKETIVSKVGRNCFKSAISRKDIPFDTMTDADFSDSYNLYFLTKDDYYDYFITPKTYQRG